MRKLNLLNKQFGKLTVIQETDPTITLYGKRRNWLCKCTCGGTIVTAQTNLQAGDTNSCGCINKETPPRLSHGLSNNRLYMCWSDMKNRCYSNKNKKYIKNYKDKGITVCNEWLDLNTFIEWAVNNGYSDNLTLDRIDTFKGYYPDNCRWTSKETQARNRKKAPNKSSTFYGVSYDSSRNKWVACVQLQDKTVFHKRYSLEIEAAQERDNYIIKNSLSNFIMNF